MRILPQTNRDWFDLLPLALKVGIILAAPVILIYHQAVSVPGLFPATVNDEMKALVQPIQVGCIVACAMLVGIGVVELFRRRLKIAIWDFVFAVFALFCWSLAELFTVRVT